MKNVMQQAMQHDVAWDYEENRRKIHEILDIALDTNSFESRRRERTGTQPTVFIDFSGHVSLISLMVYEDGYSSGGHSTNMETHFDKPISDDFVKRFRELCEKCCSGKKESETIERDLEQAKENAKYAQEVVHNLKKQLRKAVKKEEANENRG